MPIKIILLIIIIFLVILIILILDHYRKKSNNIQTTYYFDNFKIQGEIQKMEMQLDQKFKVKLKYLNDNGEPVAVENFTLIESTNPEAFEVVQLNPPEPNVYEFEVVGNTAGTPGNGFVNIDADARFGEEVRLIQYSLPVMVTPDEAESVSAEIGPLEEQE